MQPSPHILRLACLWAHLLSYIHGISSPMVAPGFGPDVNPRSCIKKIYNVYTREKRDLPLAEHACCSLRTKRFSGRHNRRRSWPLANGRALICTPLPRVRHVEEARCTPRGRPPLAKRAKPKCCPNGAQRGLLACACERESRAGGNNKTNKTTHTHTRAHK